MALSDSLSIRSPWRCERLFGVVLRPLVIVMPSSWGILAFWAGLSAASGTSWHCKTVHFSSHLYPNNIYQYLACRWCERSLLGHQEALISWPRASNSVSKRFRIFCAYRFFKVSSINFMLQKQYYSLTTPTHSAIPTLSHWSALAPYHPNKKPRPDLWH